MKWRSFAALDLNPYELTARGTMEGKRMSQINAHRRFIVGSVTGAILGTMVALGSGTTAFAAGLGARSHPSGCNYGIADSYRTWAICKHSNGGHYRAIANCKDPETGKVSSVVGNWQSSGTSFAYCYGSSRPSVPGIETKVN